MLPAGLAATAAKVLSRADTVAAQPGGLTDVLRDTLFVQARFASDDDGIEDGVSFPRIGSSGRSEGEARLGQVRPPRCLSVSTASNVNAMGSVTVSGLTTAWSEEEPPVDVQVISPVAVASVPSEDFDNAVRSWRPDRRSLRPIWGNCAM